MPSTPFCQVVARTDDDDASDLSAEEVAGVTTVQERRLLGLAVVGRRLLRTRGFYRLPSEGDSRESSWWRRWFGLAGILGGRGPGKRAYR